VTKAGAIVSVNPGSGEITAKDLPDGKPLTIRITADTHIKRMLDRESMIAMMHGGGGQQHAAHGEPGAMPPAMMSLNEMLERLPETKLEDLKTGDLFIVSSTKGAAQDRVTAISMLANAEMLLQVMAAQAGAGRGTQPGAAMTGGLEALSGMGFGVMQ
jgi:hypothetical protein